MANDSLIRLRQINKPEVSGYVVEILGHYTGSSGYSANTGDLVNVFYPLNANPNQYANSGDLTDLVTSQELDINNKNLIIASSTLFYPRVSNPSGYMQQTSFNGLLPKTGHSYSPFTDSQGISLVDSANNINFFEYIPDASFKLRNPLIDNVIIDFGNKIITGFDITATSLNGEPVFTSGLAMTSFVPWSLFQTGTIGFSEFLVKDTNGTANISFGSSNKSAIIQGENIGYPSENYVIDLYGNGNFGITGKPYIKSFEIFTDKVQVSGSDVVTNAVFNELVFPYINSLSGSLHTDDQRNLASCVLLTSDQSVSGKKTFVNTLYANSGIAVDKIYKSNNINYTSIDLVSGVIYHPISHFPQVDYKNNILSTNTVNKLNWDSGLLYHSSGFNKDVSLDWQKKILSGSWDVGNITISGQPLSVLTAYPMTVYRTGDQSISGIKTFDANLLAPGMVGGMGGIYLASSDNFKIAQNGQTVVDLYYRQLKDSNDRLAESWEDRSLWDNTETKTFDWQNKILYGSWDISSLSIGGIPIDISSMVFLTGDQFISGNKSFARPIKAPAISGLAGSISLNSPNFAVLSSTGAQIVDFIHSYFYDSNLIPSLNWENRILSGNWNATNFSVNGTPIIPSNFVDLTSYQAIDGMKLFTTGIGFNYAPYPFTVVSSGKVTNLNADYLDGFHSSYFVNTGQTGQFSIGSGYVTTGQTGQFASSYNLNLSGSGLQTQINSINLWTGNTSNIYYPRNSNPNGYVTTSQTGIFSNADTLDGQHGNYYINTGQTGIFETSIHATNTFATITNLISSGSTLQTQINTLNTWSGSTTGLYYSKNNPSGFITGLNTGSFLTTGEADLRFLNLTGKSADSDKLDGQHGSYYSNVFNLTGTTLPNSIVNSSLTSLGNLISLNVSGKVTVTTDINKAVEIDSTVSDTTSALTIYDTAQSKERIRLKRDGTVSASALEIHYSSDVVGGTTVFSVAGNGDVTALSNNINIGSFGDGSNSQDTIEKITFGNKIGSNADGSNFRIKLHHENDNSYYDHGFGVSDNMLEIVAGVNSEIGFFRNFSPPILLAKLTNSGDWIPGVNGGQDLGSTGYRWNNLFLTGNISANIISGTFAGTASNSNQLGGQLPSYYVNTTQTGAFESTAHSSATWATITNLGTTGSSLQGQVNTLSGNLITSGRNLQGSINTVSNNLASTGSNLLGQINTISTWTGKTTGLYYPYASNPANYVTTLQTGVFSNADTLDGQHGSYYVNTTQTGVFEIATHATNTFATITNLGTTGNNLQSQFNSLSGNLITSGSTLQGNINTVSNNLVTTGSNLQGQLNTITSWTGNSASIYYSKSNPNQFITSGDSDNKYATITNIASTGNNLQTQINSVKSWTGVTTSLFYPLNSNPNEYVTTSQTGSYSNADTLDGQHGSYYTNATNLTGSFGGNSASATNSTQLNGQAASYYVNTTQTGIFETSAHASSTYATISNLGSTGNSLQTQFNTLSGNFGTTNNNLATTGSNLQGQLNTITIWTGNSINIYYAKNNPNQFITSGDSDNKYATITNLASTGSSLLSSVNTLNTWTGRTTGLYYPYSSNPSNYITTSQTGIFSNADTLDGQHGSYYVNTTQTGAFAPAAGTGIFETSSHASSTYYLQTNPSNYVTSTTAGNTYATITNLGTTGSTLTSNLALTGSNLQGQINTITTWTGNSSSIYYPRSSNPNNYVTTSQTGVYSNADTLDGQHGNYYLNAGNLTGSFGGNSASATNASQLNGQSAAYYYPASNPNSYITSGNSDAKYSTIANLASTGSNLQGQINTVTAWTGNSANLYYPRNTNPNNYITSSQTGSYANADTVDGYHVSEANVNGTIVARNSNGYVFADIFNSNHTYDTYAASGYFFEVNDGCIRKKTISSVKTELVTNASVVAGLGYTPINKAGDSSVGNLSFNGAAPQITLANGTSNYINLSAYGVGLPTFTTRSVGTKIVLWANVGASAADYAIGINDSTLWNSVVNTGARFEWYGGTTLAMTLVGNGNLTTVGAIQATTAKLTNLTNGYIPFHVDSSTGLSNSVIYTDGTNVGIGTTTPTNRLTIGPNFTSDANLTTPSLRVQGVNVSDGTGHYYSSYGGIIFNATTDYTSSARRYLITNALHANKFAIIRSVDSATDPTLGTGGTITSGTADFVMDNTGNVGIGLTNPSTTLHVNGTVTATAFSGPLTGTVTGTASNATQWAGHDFSSYLNQAVLTNSSPTFAGLALGPGSLALTGSIGATGSRVTKVWATDLEVTNTIVGSVNGNAATATNIYNTGTVMLASSTEANAITITQPAYTTGQPVKLLNFYWYSDIWSLGNIRSGGTPSAGFGVFLNSAEKFRFNPTGEFLSGGDNAQDIGSSGLRWKNGYFAGYVYTFNLSVSNAVTSNLVPSSGFDLGSTGYRWGTVWAGNLYGTLQTAAQGNITSVGTLTSLAVSNTANIAGSIVLAGITTERTFGVTFGNASNQNVDLYFTGNYSGYLDVTISSGYNYNNAGGGIKKRFAVMCYNNAVITNTSRYLDISDNTAAAFAIGELTWDSANSRYKIPIGNIYPNGANAANVLSISVKFYSIDSGFSNVVGLTSIYTQAVSYPASVYSFNKDTTFSGGVSAAGFVGPLTGEVTGNASTATNASNASAVSISSSSISASPICFIDNGGIGSFQAIHASTGIYITPTAGSITATTFVGALTGNASTATSATTAGTSEDSSKLGGALPGAYALVGQTMYLGTTAVAINRGTGALTLNGVSIGGSAAQVVTTTSSINQTAYLYFGPGTSGSQNAYVNTGLTYNGSTGVLTAGTITATTFNGTLNGNASTADSAGIVTTAAQTNITSLGQLTGLIVKGIISKYTVTGIDGTADNLIKFGYYNDLQVGGSGNTNRYHGIDSTISSGLGSSNKMLFKLFQGGENNTAPATILTLQGDGKVGVGKDPSYALDVSGSIRTDTQLISTVSTGTAPLSVASTTMVQYLNAQYLNGASSFVPSVNGITGAVTIAAGTNVTVSSAGSTVTINSSGGGAVSSVNAKTGAVVIAAGTNVTVDTSGTSIVINSTASGTAGVSAVNAQTGAVTIEAGSNVYVTTSSGIITIGASGSGTSGVSSLNGQTGAVTLAAGTAGISITSSGVGTILISTSSDKRLKRKIKKFKNASKLIEQLPIVEWEFNGKGETNEGEKGIGIIAQEVKDIVPNCVATRRGKINKTDKEETDIYIVNNSNFLGILMKATQELILENKKLQNRVSILENANRRKSKK